MTNILLTMICAFAVSLILGRILIPILRRLKAGQAIREDGPTWHNSKAGTPTMGGLCFMGASLLCIVFGFPALAAGDRSVLYVLLFSLSFGLVGFLDDFFKVKYKRNLGLTSIQKACLQMAVSALFLYILYKEGIITNINRQLMATTETVGRVKVEAMKERLLAINPDADITAIQRFYTAENAEEFHLEDYDYIVDAIDSLQDKALLILNACRTKARFYSSMGAALKLDPTRIQVAEFWNVKGCPLGAALRRKFKKQKLFPARKFKCVFSEELLTNQGESDEALGFKAQINGSLSHITAIFGFTIAGLIIQDIVKRQEAE